jgi:ribosome-binding protein aMBF1 (putative translation factor)
MMRATQVPTRAVRAFAGNLVRERRRRGYSTDGLARQVAGMRTSELQRLELGIEEPRLTAMLRLARALGVELADLLDDAE